MGPIILGLVVTHLGSMEATLAHLETRYGGSLASAGFRSLLEMDFHEEESWADRRQP